MSASQTALRQILDRLATEPMQDDDLAELCRRALDADDELLKSAREAFRLWDTGREPAFGVAMQDLGETLLAFAGDDETDELFASKVTPAGRDAADLEHWSSPNGCHEDCPACAAERDADEARLEAEGQADAVSDADELNEQLAAIGVTWADVTETDPERSEPPTPAECQLVREFLAIKDKAYAEAAKQDDEWPTNATRAQRASEVLDFRRRQGLGETEDDSTTLQDILSDVRHLCDERGLDYAIIDKAAYRNYAAEVAESLTAGERAAVDAEVSEQLTQAVREATQHADESR